jgi:hypothetical protein
LQSYIPAARLLERPNMGGSPTETMRINKGFSLHDALPKIRLVLTMTVVRGLIQEEEQPLIIGKRRKNNVLLCLIFLSLLAL